MTRPIATITLATAVCLIVPGSAQDTHKEVRTYLTGAGFAAADLDRLEAGEVIARVNQPDSNVEEVIVVAAVKIRVPREQVASYYGQMISYVDGEVTLAFGRFSSPPALSDVQGLALDRDEIDALRTCRVGDCDIRLSGASLASLRAAVNWDAVDYVDQANGFIQQAAARYVADYQKRGDAALITYNDRAEPVRLRDQWAGILANASAFHQYVPELRSYLAGYPAASLPGGRDIFYWVKENYGLKPVLSIVHGVVYEPAGKADRVFIVQKQLYASHYYDGSLAMGTVLSAVENGAPVSYLLYANRSRGDLLKGGFGGLRRNVARRQAQSAAEQTLGTIQRVLERRPAR